MVVLCFPAPTGHLDFGLSLLGFSLSSSVKLSKAFLEEPSGDLSVLPVLLGKEKGRVSRQALTLCQLVTRNFDFIP